MTAWPIIIARATGRLRCASEAERAELLRRYSDDPAVREALEQRPVPGEELQRLAEDLHRVQEGRRRLQRQAEAQERELQASGAAAWKSIMARLSLATRP